MKTPLTGDPTRKTHVYGYLLETGDVLQENDRYSSNSGYWELCPCPGLKLEAMKGGPVWVRPT